MENLEIIDHEVTDNQMNEFEADVRCLFQQKKITIKVKSPWSAMKIHPHTIELLNLKSEFSEEQKELLKKVIASYLKQKIVF